MAALFCSTIAKTVKIGKYPTDTIQTRNGGKLRITFFAHASLLFEYDGKHIYTDPVQAHADYSTLPSADLIMVTHEHSDHFDVNAIEQLSTPATLLISNESTVNLFGSGKAIKHGEKISLPFVDIEALAAYNTTADRLGFHPAERADNGYIITFGGTRVYLASDSEDTPQMLAVKDIDIAFLPVNQPYTMTEQQAARAVKAIKPKIFYPYHYGQTDHKTDLEILKNLLADEGVDIRIRPME